MSSILQTFLLAGALHLDPAQTKDYEAITTAIANVVARERPLFRNDDDRFRTASLVEAMAWREGSLRLKVQGDCDKSKPGEPCKGKPHSFCTMQIHDTSGGTEALNDDPEACIKKAMDMIRESMRMCADAPIAFYASGPGACTNTRALAISRDRVALSRRIYVFALAAVKEAA